MIMRRYLIWASGTYFEITRAKSLELLDDDRYMSKVIGYDIIFTRRY